MIVVLIALAVLFGCKILWNLCVPYVAGRRYKSAERSSISLHIVVDVVLLGATLIVAAISHDSYLPIVAVAGPALLVASYIHLIIMSRVL